MHRWRRLPRVRRYSRATCPCGDVVVVNPTIDRSKFAIREFQRERSASVPRGASEPPGPSGWTYKIKFFSRGWEFGYNVVELHVPIQKENIMEGEDSLLFVDQLLSNANPSKIQLY